MIIRRPALALACTLALVACTGRPVVAPADALDDGDSAETADVIPDTAPSPFCNPLGFGEPCVAPFPSAYYEEADPSRASGYRVALPTEALPMARASVALDPAPFDRNDGFSPSGPFIAVFPERIDPASLVPPGSMAQSMTASSSTVILDMDSGQRVAHMSEVDATAPTSQRQAVILRPAQRLLAGHRYAIAIARSARTITGDVPTSPPGFAALRDGTPTSDGRLDRVRGRYDAIFTALARAGVARTDLLVAWDVVTASESSITEPVLGMRDDAFAMLGTDGLAITVTSIEDDFNTSIQRRVRGTFRVPQFLSDATPNATLARDAQGRPRITSVADVPFVAMIPRSATTASGPLPIVQFGHGLFGSAAGEFGEATEPTAYMQRVANEDGYVLFGTDWTGLSRDDLSRVIDALGNLNLMPRTSDHLQQSLVNAMVLYRTAHARFAADPAFAVGGRAVVDPTRQYFLGISLGAIMGTSFMGYDPDCDRAVLNVFGGVWSTLFQRSDGWGALRVALNAYPRTVDQQILFVLAQSLFDPVDPINLAPHLLTDRLRGVPPRQLLFQEAVGDSAVTNLASETVARTLGIPLLSPSVRTPFGANPQTAPIDSAWVIVDEHPTPLPPDTNLPAPANPTHTHMREVTSVREQIRRFFRPGGVVEQTCDGPCDPN